MINNLKKIDVIYYRFFLILIKYSNGNFISILSTLTIIKINYCTKIIT